MTVLEDEKIIDLYWERSQNAITETDRKYRKRCMYIAENILKDISDAEECLSDTYLTAWNLMPPDRPVCLPAFLFRIIKNHALNRFAFYKREKRRKDACTSFDEIEEFLGVENSTEDGFDERELVNALNEFLEGLDTLKRVIFMRKYWFFDSVSQISERCAVSEENVKVILLRTRLKLKTFLYERGLIQ